MYPGQSRDISLATLDPWSDLREIWVLCLRNGTSMNSVVHYFMTDFRCNSYFRYFRVYPDVPYFGFYKLMTPAVCVRDLELVKRVLIRDFASFPVTDFKISKKHDELMSRNPFFLSGEEWQTERKNATRSITANKVC